MNTELPFDLVNLSADDVQELEDTYQALQAKFNIIPVTDSNIHLEQFDRFNTSFHIHGIDIGSTLLLKIPTNNCYLVFLKLRYSYYAMKATTRSDYYKYQAWAFITSNKDFGRALIRHETFQDRIVSLLHPCELNFKDDKAFDHNFYVVTNDEQKALMAMNSKFRNTVMKMGDAMIMETAGHTIVIGNNMSVEADQTVQLAEFAMEVAALK